jgi:two-component system CheB/CheR fusion protein
MPARIASPAHPSDAARTEPDCAGRRKQQGAVDKVLLLLRGRSGTTSRSTRRSTLNRRIERRMALHQLPRSPTTCVTCARTRRNRFLFKELLIGVTSFFRDPPSLGTTCKNEVIPAAAGPRPEAAATLRAWVAGCSTGEEAYSLAIVFSEAQAAKLHAGRTPPCRSLPPTSTTTPSRAPAGSTRPASPTTSRRSACAASSCRTNGATGSARTIREMVIFAPQNLVMDPPFTRSTC